MMASLPILTILTLVPLLGAFLILVLIRKEGERPVAALHAQYMALATAAITFVLSLMLLWGFDPHNTGFQYMERFMWLPAFNMEYIRGVDGIGIWFVLAATLLTPLCILSMIGREHKRVKELMVIILVLESMMIGVFSSLDMVLFYLFFEGILIPMFLIIGVWGGEKRTYAAYKFFLYTFWGSVLMLVAVFAMVLYVGTTDMTQMMGNKFPKEMAIWLWLAFFASFAVKTPMWPFHTWLPYAHVEASTAGSVILAAVLLKIGGYGFIRVCIQMLPEASVYFAPLMIGLSLIAIVYGSLVAIAQTDMKKLIAYSSVAHMGYVTLGLFCFNQQAWDGAMMVMLSHTFVSGALFLCVGVVYDRMHTRDIARFGGVAQQMPRYAVFFMLATLGAVGLPGTSGFVGELMALQGAYLANSWYALVASLGVVLGAVYMLWLYQRVFYGPLDKPEIKEMPDMTVREYCMLIPLVGMIIVVGIYPHSMRAVYGPTLDHALSEFQNVLHAVPQPHHVLPAESKAP